MTRRRRLTRQKNAFKNVIFKLQSKYAEQEGLIYMMKSTQFIIFPENGKINILCDDLYNSINSFVKRKIRMCIGKPLVE